MFEMLSTQTISNSKLSFVVSNQSLIIKRTFNYLKRSDIEKELGA